MKKQAGITLIALIITIIVMLILVSVTLTITLGENGIISKTKEAKEKTEEAIILENITSIALGKYDTLSGVYKFPELKEEIRQTYPDITLEYYIIDEQDNILPLFLSDEEFEILYQDIEEDKKDRVVYVVTKGNLSIIIAKDGIRVGSIESDDIIEEDGNNKYVFTYSGPNALISQYIGNEKNIKIPTSVHHFNENNEGAVSTISTIKEYAFCDMSYNHEQVKIIDDVVEFSYADTRLEKSKDQIELGEFLVLLGFNTHEYSNSEILVYTDNPTEKTIVNNIMIELYVKGALNFTEEDCYKDESNNLYIYKRGTSYVSQKRTNKIAETITVPQYVETIESLAFGYIKTLREVTFEHDDSRLYNTTFNYIFEGCENLEIIKFPNATMETVKSRLHHYSNAWGANKAIKIICSDGTIEVPEA